MQIVIGWMEQEQVLVKAGRVDLGELNKFKTVPKPMVCMWVNSGTEKDLAKATAYASSEGKVVLTYQKEKNPLEAARRDLLRGVAA